MTRVAAVDCGTNSLRWLVADIDVHAATVREVERRTTIVRLGQGVDATGRFAPEALDRTFAAVDDCARVVAAASVEALRFVATSAARDVGNRDELLTGIRTRLGVTAEIISGEEEARLSHAGATRCLGGDIAAPVVVLDIGGGSTELVTRSGADGPVRGESLDVGSVRLTERHLHGDPPGPAEVEAASAVVEEALDSLSLPLAATGTLVGVAGSVTTMAALVLRLPAYDRARVHGVELPRNELLAAVNDVVRMTVAQRRALPFMHPGRADVIAGGALVLAAVVHRTQVPGVLVSEQDILDAIAWSIA